jgi:hypothetical protein
MRKAIVRCLGEAAAFKDALGRPEVRPRVSAWSDSDTDQLLALRSTPLLFYINMKLKRTTWYFRCDDVPTSVDSYSMAWLDTMCRNKVISTTSAQEQFHSFSTCAQSRWKNVVLWKSPAIGTHERYCAEDGHAPTLRAFRSYARS